jgi:DNA invertase Pin-like site-specific DNA recombinase
MIAAKVKKPAGRFGVAYVRVSDAHQDVESQKKAIEEWAAKHGLEIVAWYIDVGGKRHFAEKRPEFQRLLNDVATGTISWVVIDSKIRFGVKHHAEYGKFLCHLMEHGVELWSVAQGLLTSTDDLTTITSAIDSLQSTAEQKEKARRSIRGKMLRAKQGGYSGGHVPYGYDVACLDKTGVEKWRVIIVGRHQRIKHYPDGTEERYDGKDNFPAHDKDDDLRYRPSILKERVTWAANIFRMLATEATSYRRLAKMLTDAGVKPYYGECWFSNHIKNMVTNPIYIGFPTWNKSAGGSFVEWSNNTYSEVEWVNNQPLKRTRKVADWILCDEREDECKMVDDETWKRVQEKVQGIKGGKRSPRSDDLWLKDLCYCAKCMRVMRGWHPRKKPVCRSYFCSNYNDYQGPNNPTGCKTNRVSADLLEKIVDRYLEETGQKTKVLLAYRSNKELLTSLLHQMGDKESELFAILNQMKDFVKPHLTPEQQDLLGVEGGIGISDAYEQYFQQEQERLQLQIASMDDQLEAMVDAYKDLPPIAREKARKKMEVLEEEIGRLKAQVDPLTERMDSVYDQLTRMDAGIATAQVTVREQSNRQKAEAVSRVIDKIICHFVENPDRKPNEPSSIPTMIEVVPVSGSGNQPVSYPCEISPRSR